MAFVPSKGAEPILGYQLMERLGTGGYGAVWKTTAPGGLTKAIKIVFGDMEGHQAEQELKALRRIKEVRHPFLLSLERFEIIDGQLFIVTELADKSLLDRFVECRMTGLRGIPRDELLSYLRDASEALDYMGETYGLQHLDIKPQNLLLVGGRIKVADFGLVKELVGTSVTATGGVTPIYATPEAFDGRVSRFSDQYSLAIVYQEMLTGVRPYPGTTVLQLAAQHMSSRPFLDPLPAQDRPVILRALSKVPEQRYPSCREMVENLLRGHGSSPVIKLPDEETVPTVNKAPTPHEGPISLYAEGEENALALGGATEVGMTPSGRATQAPPPGVRLGQTPPPVDSILDSQPWGTGQVELRPTLFLGLGGLACATLRRLRQRLHRRFGNLRAVPILRFLLVDTDRGELRSARLGEGGEALALEETILAPLRPPESYRAHSKSFLRWLDRRWLYGIPHSLSTEGLRPLGHLALVDNSADVLARLRETLLELTSQPAKIATRNATGMELRDDNPRIFLVASIAGATGGGMLAGMAYAVRQVLQELHLSDEGLCGMLVHATSPKPAESDMARINAYATLQELNHYSAASAAYPGNPDQGLASFEPGKRPFSECYLVHLGDKLSKADAEAATEVIAEYLYLDAATSEGAFLDRHRRNTRTSTPDANEIPSVRGFGLYRIAFPKYRLAKLATSLLCQQLVDRWPGGPTGKGVLGIEAEAQDLVTQLALDQESLGTRFFAAAKEFFGEDPETFLPRVLAEGLAKRNPADPAGSDIALTGLLLEKADRLMGQGADPNEGPLDTPVPLEVVLKKHARDMGTQASQQIVEWLLELVEHPEKRLWAADGASRWMVQYLLAAAEAIRGQCNQLRTYRGLLRQTIIEGKPPGKSSGIRWLRFRKSQKTSEKLQSKLLDYCWLRLAELGLENSVTVLLAIHKKLSHFNQEMTHCRQKLSLFAALFQAPPEVFAAGSNLPAIPNVTELLPYQTSSLVQAAAKIVEAVSPEVLHQLDENFQVEVLDQEGGLWAMVAENADPLLKGTRRGTSSLAFWDLVARDNNLAQGLKEKLLDRARPLVLGALRGVDAAQLFLDSKNDSDEMGQALSSYVQAARPRLQAQGCWQHLIMALPKGPAGDTLKDAVLSMVSNTPVTVLQSQEDVILCFETARLPLGAMAEAFIDNKSSYAEMAKKVLTRVDVDWSAIGSK